MPAMTEAGTYNVFRSRTFKRSTQPIAKKPHANRNAGTIKPNSLMLFGLASVGHRDVENKLHVFVVWLATVAYQNSRGNKLPR